MESKIEQPVQKTEKLKTEKLKINFEKFKERYEQFRDSDLIRTFRNTLLALGTALYVACAPTIQQTPTKPIEPPKQTSTVQTSHTTSKDPETLPFDEENLKKLSRAELKGSNYTLHILHYKERIKERKRVKKLDDFRQLSSYFYLSSKDITVLERDKTKSNYYFSIGAYDYFFNIYTKPLEFELYVKIDGKGSYTNTNNEKRLAEFDMTADVLQKKEPIKQNSVKVFISYVPNNVMYKDQKDIEESVVDRVYPIEARRLGFNSNDPNKPISTRNLTEPFIYQIFRNAILSNTYTLSLDIDKNSGQKDPFLKGLIDLAQNPTDPNTYSIIKPLFEKIEEQMVDIMLKKYQNYRYRHLLVSAKIFVFVIDPAKQDNIQIVVVPGDLSIQFNDSRYPKPVLIDLFF
jgi:hypothetical protein